MSARGPQVDSRTHPVRFAFCVGALGLLAGALVGRLLMLQFLDVEQGHVFLQSQGDQRSVRYAPIPASRGAIVDRNGSPLALSTPVVTIAINPSQFQRENLSFLARALNRKLKDLEAEFDRRATLQFMYVRRQVSPVEAQSVIESNLPGLIISREHKRFYPAGELVAQLVGLTNRDQEGVSGIELAYDKALSGQVGRKKYIQDRHGRAIRDIGVIDPAADGQDLRLSIDLRLQYVQFRALQRAVEKFEAESASAITVDAQTGEVLAVSNFPSFNPNDRVDLPVNYRRNRVFVDQYEPGSTFKALTAVAALESGLFTPESMFETSPGWMVVQGKTFKDTADYGSLTLREVVAKSSQVGTTQIALELGRDALLPVLQRFGVGQSLGIGFPGEASGSLPLQSRWSDIEQATLAFGYGLSLSPAQLASFYSVFANQGRMQPMTLLAQDDVDRSIARPIISPVVAEQVLDMLRAVTEKGGTGLRANVAGFSVAGKTGTVHKSGAQGYQRDQYIAWFAGVAPATDPRFVTVVMVDGPKGESVGGGAVAAPVFADMSAAMLRVMGESPSHQDQIMRVAKVAAAVAGEAQDG